jgi:hypothetical protein
VTIVIQKPLENIKIAGKNVKAVGIPEWRLEGEPSMVTVDIQYRYLRGKYKERQFPYPLQIAKSEILRGEKRFEKTADGKEQLFYIIPVSKMAEVKPKAETPIAQKTEMPQRGKQEQLVLVDYKYEIPTKPHWVCKDTKFWKTIWGEYLCSRCHPNPDPEVNQEEIDIVEKAQK